MVLGISRLLWASLASSSWWLQTAARGGVLLKASYFIYSVFPRLRRSNGRSQNIWGSLFISLTHSLSFHLSDLSTWYPQQGSLQVVRFLIGHMKTPRVGIPQEQGETCMPLFIPGLGIYTVLLLLHFLLRQ